MAFYIKEKKLVDALNCDIQYVLDYVRSIDEKAYLLKQMRGLCRAVILVDIGIGYTNYISFYDDVIVVNPICNSKKEFLTKDVFEHLSNYFCERRDKIISRL